MHSNGSEEANYHDCFEKNLLRGGISRYIQQYHKRYIDDRYHSSRLHESREAVGGGFDNRFHDVLMSASALAAFCNILQNSPNTRSRNFKLVQEITCATKHARRANFLRKSTCICFFLYKFHLACVRGISGVRSL